MKTTVIIPVFNRPGHLVIAVKSLMQQPEGIDLDVLIVDDGSTDETPDVIAKLRQFNPKIRTVRRENGGVAQARNAGLENLLAETEVVTFLDSDDAMTKNRFAADLAVLMNCPDVDVTYGNMIVTDQLDETTLMPTENAVSCEVTGIHLTSGLFRRRLIDRIGRFDSTLKQAEDTDYLLRIFESHTKFIQTSTVCHFYLRHSGNMTNEASVSKKSFALAIMKSMQRRRADPSLRINKPSFQIELPHGLW